ncbi:MAG: HAMP domain-containing sensor histidine kinase [Bacteroidota bacterium]|nr:HAMP domain-containing sensor histidine kinase [Bacteroidota bacterium]
MTFKARIIISFFFLSLIVIGSFSVYVYFYYASYRKELFISRLSSKADVIEKLDQGQDRSSAISNSMIYTDLITLFDEKVILIDNQKQITYTNIVDGNVLDSHMVILQNAKIQSKYYYTAFGQTEIIVTQFKNGSKLIISAVDILGNDKLNNLTSTLVLGNSFALALSILLGLIFADAIVKPLNNITRTLNRISDKDLTYRLEVPKGKDELFLISTYFNGMMDRLQKSFINQKNFISHASHEMRTPLTKVLVNLQSIQRRQRKGSESYKDITLAIDDTKVAVELVNGLLQLALVSKIEELELSTMRLDDIFLAILSDLKEKYPSITVKFDLKNKDEEFEPIECKLQKELFPVALYNIIENSVKYANGNPVEISIIKENNIANVFIRDNGLGILPSDIKYIYEPLYRGQNAITKKGFGIGLSLVKRILDLHQITFNLESVPQTGTVVTLYIPTN